MSNVRILHDNFLDPDFYVDMTYSSQRAATPATNVLDGVRRTKVWRTAGYYDINEFQTDIAFEETLGVTLIASIADGEYQSDADFFAAIKFAMEAVGGSTYTVERDTATNKIKITSNGAGGTGLFNLILETGEFTLATRLGFDLTNLSGALSYVADNLKLHSAEWVMFDFGTAVNPKAFAAVGNRNEVLKFSETAFCIIEGSHTTDFTGAHVSLTVDYSDFGFVLMDSAGFGAARYWRIRFINHNEFGYLELSNIYLGGFIESSRGGVQFPLDIEPIDLSEVTYGRSGTRFVDENESTEQITFGWSGLTTTDKEELEDFAREAGRVKPFFIALDPDGVFGSSVARNTRLVAFIQPPTFALVSPGNWSSKWSVREEV